MPNEIVKLYKAGKMFDAKEAVISEMNAKANQAMDGQKQFLAKNLFRDEPMSEELEESTEENSEEKKNLTESFEPLNEEGNVKITVKNLKNRDDIDEVLQMFEHDVKKDVIVMSETNAKKFNKEIEKRRIKL